jgi:hypothetical protein
MKIKPSTTPVAKPSPTLNAPKSPAFGRLPSALPAIGGDTFGQWVNRANVAKDTPFDGKLVGAGAQTFAPGTPLSQIPGVQPSNGKPANGSILYVNGMLTPLTQQLTDMQAIADTTGAQVLGVHNSTQGFVADAAQSAADVAGIGNNPAVTSLAQTIKTELQAGRPLTIFAHSQGAAITQRAVKQVGDELGSDALKLLTVKTFGGAAGVWPDGPTYDHYVNKDDLVPTMFGVGAPLGPLGAGAGAQIHGFDNTDPDQLKRHLLETSYLPELAKENAAVN